jgi:CubicO group peptidase (beta-lactamase class C family)
LTARKFDPSLIHGSVAPGFEEVEAAFRDNFSRGRELGAACAIYHRGEKVVDLWGGYCDEQKQSTWEEDTMVPVFSTTKGIAALTMAVAHSQSLFDYDEPVANYWPEFAQEGKQEITIRQLLAHQAGLCAIDEPLDLDLLADLDAVAAVVARQKPAWEPGTRHGYHCWTLGLYQNELIRRVDPRRRSIGQFLQDELAGPLGAEFYIGLPPEVPGSRVATLKAFSHLRLFCRIDQIPLGFTLRYMIPGSLAARTVINPNILTKHANMNRRDVLSLELASATGVGHARAIARIYGAFATGGREINLRQQTFDALSAPALTPPSGLRDALFCTDTSYSLGFYKPWRGFRFGSPASFGVPGAGGSFGYADPDVQIGFAYTPNKMDVYFVDDPRHKALRRALYRCLDKAQG